MTSDLRKILLVSGKVYYDLIKEIDAKGLQTQIRVVRIEELCPFPFALLASTLRDIVKASGVNPGDVKIQWVQEEARNQGAYGYAAHRTPSVFEALGWDQAKMEYIGRRPMEVPAVGAAVLHARDKQHFISQALRVDVVG